MKRGLKYLHAMMRRGARLERNIVSKCSGLHVDHIVDVIAHRYLHFTTKRYTCLGDTRRHILNKIKHESESCAHLHRPRDTSARVASNKRDFNIVLKIGCFPAIARFSI